MEFNPSRTAVVVVDMQNDFAHSDGALYAPPSGEVIDPIQTLLDTARGSDVPVFFTRDEHPEDQFDDSYYYDEFDQWGEHVVEGSWGAEIIDDFDVRPEDTIIDKRTYDAFHETNLEERLRGLGVTDLIICGTLANVCVLHTASSAGLRDFRPVIVSDAVGYITDDHRDYALEHADWLFGETAPLDDIAFE